MRAVCWGGRSNDDKENKEVEGAEGVEGMEEIEGIDGIGNMDGGMEGTLNLEISVIDRKEDKASALESLHELYEQILWILFSREFWGTSTFWKSFLFFLYLEINFNP